MISAIERGGDRERLGGRVDGAEGAGEEVEDGRGEQRRRDRGAVAPDPARQGERQATRAKAPPSVEDGRRQARGGGREAELAGGPDAERLERRELARQVAEPALVGPVGMQGAEVGEVDEAAEFRQAEQRRGRATRDPDGEQRSVA